MEIGSHKNLPLPAGSLFVHMLLCYFPIFQIQSSSKDFCDAINSIVSHKRGLILVPYDHLSVCLFFLVLHLEFPIIFHLVI